MHLGTKQQQAEEMKMNKLERVIHFLFSYHNKNGIIESEVKWEILLETLNNVKRE